MVPEVGKLYLHTLKGSKKRFKGQNLLNYNLLLCVNNNYGDNDAFTFIIIKHESKPRCRIHYIDGRQLSLVEPHTRTTKAGIKNNILIEYKGKDYLKALTLDVKPPIAGGSELYQSYLTFKKSYLTFKKSQLNTYKDSNGNWYDNSLWLQPCPYPIVPTKYNIDNIYDLNDLHTINDMVFTVSIETRYNTYQCELVFFDKKLLLFKVNPETTYVQN